MQIREQVYSASKALEIVTRYLEFMSASSLEMFKTTCLVIWWSRIHFHHLFPMEMLKPLSFCGWENFIILDQLCVERLEASLYGLRIFLALIHAWTQIPTRNSSFKHMWSARTRQMLNIAWIFQQRSPARPQSCCLHPFCTPFRLWAFMFFH